jgi:uncharacterized protein (DUF2252 family)
MTSRAERYQHGRALRAQTPRSAHAQWEPPSPERDPVAVIEESNAGRIPGLIPLRYARMSKSPFAFLRGSAILQARDLAGSPSTGVTVQLCGDCHVSNFGGFGTPERNLVFDINDFDETFPGPWEWDLKRLAVSFVLAARDRSFSKETAENAVREASRTYRERMTMYGDESALAVWYTQIDFEELCDFFRRYTRTGKTLTDEAKAAVRHTSEGLYPKLTTVEDGRATIIDNPPLVYHFHQYAQQWQASVKTLADRYRHSMPDDRRHLFDQYTFQDIAVKVVGVGSVGTRCLVALYLADETDPLFLQIKEARRSVLEAPEGKSRFAHQGERVVEGQRLMQSASDIFLGWVDAPEGYDYYVRQLRDMKISANIEAFAARDFGPYAVMCGWALARAHAKGGDAATIAGYLGTGENFDDALVRYALAYADQVDRDFEAFTTAIHSGRLRVDEGDAGNIEFPP